VVALDERRSEERQRQLGHRNEMPAPG
jgi:hypothetical protein